MQISQKGFDLVNSCPDIWSALCIQVLADTGSVDYDPESAASVISSSLGADINQAREMVRNLTAKGYLDDGRSGGQPQSGRQMPGLQGRVPSPTIAGSGNISTTQEGVPSVLPTQGQTRQAESGGAIPSVLPGKPGDQTAVKEKFQNMLRPPKGLKA